MADKSEKKPVNEMTITITAKKKNATLDGVKNLGVILAKAVEKVGCTNVTVSVEACLKPDGPCYGGSQVYPPKK